jgi:hypothetical protein
MNTLPPDREMLIRFAAIMFKHANPKGYVSLRAFPDTGSRGQKALFVYPITLGDKDFANMLVEHARWAAEWHVSAVFCPPVATFRDHQNAKTDNIFEGVAVSVECDQHPLEARQTLETLLGMATAVVESGGEWTTPATGEIEPKVHLHWRLSKPASTKAEHGLLREARALATKLVGGDGTNISIVHPIRWPGSWHRKGTPRLARIIAFSDDSEIDLADALEVLREATGAATFTGFGFKTTGKLRAADDAYAASALSVIPNGTDPKAHDWEYWNGIGMKTWAATVGSEAGRAAFHTWSSKSPKYNKAKTEARWDHYKTSPPTKAGFGSLVYLARQHSPGWTYGNDKNYTEYTDADEFAGTSGSPHSGGPVAPANSEEFLALVFTDRHQADLRFVAKWGQWFRWDSLRWALEETLHAFDMARAICREAANACNKDSTAKTLASAKTVAAVERLAKADRKLAATFEQWDIDFSKINTSEEE